MATTVYVVDPDPDERTWIKSVLAPTVEAVVFFDDAAALLAHQPIREDACLVAATERGGADARVLRLMRAALLVAAAAVLAGCALKSPPPHTDVVEQALPKETRIPATWRAGSRGDEVTNDWLKSFNDPALDAIVAEAIANNLDLRAAATKVAIAQQTVIVVGSRLLPWAGAPPTTASAADASRSQ